MTQRHSDAAAMTALQLTKAKELNINIKHPRIKLTRQDIYPAVRKIFQRLENTTNYIFASTKSEK